MHLCIIKELKFKVSFNQNLKTFFIANEEVLHCKICEIVLMHYVLSSNYEFILECLFFPSLLMNFKFMAYVVIHHDFMA
jgi:hypothetical protein